ncbi:MAG: ATP synthase F1 subunit gamma, partial [Acidobacteriota bacterium]
MPNLQGIRRRIRSVRNMRQITKAMKLVSASRLKRAQDRVTAARPYAAKLREVLDNLAARAGDYQHPLLERRGDEFITVILITADRGLCGAFNTNLLKAALRFQQEHHDKKIDFITIGRRGRDFFRRRNATIRNEYIGLVSKTIEYTQAAEIGKEIIRVFIEEVEDQPRPDKVYLIYSEFKSALQQRIIVNQILPIGNLAAVEEAVAKEGESQVDYVYEQPPAEIFGQVLPHFIETQIFQALLESVASEHGSRMTAMDSASKNATEMIDSLTLNMNRIRQAAITREIIEV